MDYSEQSDEKIVEIVRSGNKDIYEELVLRYQSKLFRYVRYLIKDAHKAEDVVQETFIKTYINLRGFNTKRKFSSWIYRIAHNEAINAVKKNRKETFLTEKGWFMAQPKTLKTPETELSDKETSKLIRQHLNKLPLKYKEPLTLFFLEEKSYKEISDILRLSIGGVGARINRAKIMLRNIYTQNKSLSTDSEKTLTKIHDQKEDK
jgi:RNA polymerase sigma-70 factor, ECF subfamily